MADFVETIEQQRLERIRTVGEEGEDAELEEEDVLLMIGEFDFSDPRLPLPTKLILSRFSSSQMAGMFFLPVHPTMSSINT